MDGSNGITRAAKLGGGSLGVIWNPPVWQDTVLDLSVTSDDGDTFGEGEAGATGDPL